MNDLQITKKIDFEQYPKNGTHNHQINQDLSRSLVKYEKKDTLIPACTIIAGQSVNYDAHQNIDAILNPNYPLSCLELCDSDAWIKKYGLKTNRLTFENILATIGFKQTQGLNCSDNF